MGPRRRPHRPGPRRRHRLRTRVPRRHRRRAARPGEKITAGEACGDIESTKSDSDLIAPVTGTVRAINDDLTRKPEVVNADPYGQGWLFDVDIDPATLTRQLASLLDAGAYRELAGG